MMPARKKGRAGLVKVPPADVTGPPAPDNAHPAVGSTAGRAGPPDPRTAAVGGWLDLDPDGPCRPPDFRWRLAGLLAAGAKLPRGWADRWVRRAAAVLGHGEKAGVAATNGNSAVRAAWELALCADGWTLVEVEGRLLAGQRPDLIAGKLRLPVSTIEAYEKLYFAVSGRLKHRGYVVHIILGLNTPRGETDVGVCVRAYAYFNGALVLEAMLDAFRADAGAGATGGMPDDVAELRQLCRLAVALRTTPVTAGNAAQWVRLHVLMRELGAREGRPAGG